MISKTITEYNLTIFKKSECKIFKGLHCESVLIILYIIVYIVLYSKPVLYFQANLNIK